MNKTEIEIYMDFGVVFSYYVDNTSKAREHADAIIKTGYRHTPKGSEDLEWYPPCRIKKIKIIGGAESSQYQDKSRAT